MQTTNNADLFREAAAAVSALKTVVKLLSKATLSWREVKTAYELAERVMDVRRTVWLLATAADDKVNHPLIAKRAQQRAATRQMELSPRAAHAEARDIEQTAIVAARAPATIARERKRASAPPSTEQALREQRRAYRQQLAARR